MLFINLHDESIQKLVRDHYKIPKGSLDEKIPNIQNFAHTNI